MAGPAGGRRTGRERGRFRGDGAGRGPRTQPAPGSRPGLGGHEVLRNSQALDHAEFLALTFAGQLDRARSRATELHPGCAASLATALALTGRPEPARDLLSTLDDADPLFAPQLLRARCWIEAIEGRTAAASELARRAAGLAAASGQRALEAGLLHDLVRMGGAAAVADDLRALADDIDSPVVRAAADHAAGSADGPAERLDAVSMRFEELGAVLLAADAAADAATRHHSVGHHRRGTAATARVPRRPLRRRADPVARRAGRTAPHSA